MKDLLGSGSELGTKKGTNLTKLEVSVKKNSVLV